MTIVTQMTSPSFPILKRPHLTLDPENYSLQVFPLTWASQVALAVKNWSANAGDRRDMGSIPRSGRPPGGGHGKPFQYSCLENPMDRGAWQTTVHRVPQSLTQLK